MKKFNSLLKDSQSTEVIPVQPEEFDFDEYKAYADKLNIKCDAFWKAESGVMVYRRMRVGECFSYGCRDMKKSLEYQLGALKKSINFKADIPNFLEPWYGIGTIASAYGGDYLWPAGNAPAMKPAFGSIDKLLEVLPGHGFASSTQWSGLGMSDDNAIMISPEQYLEIANPSAVKICSFFGGYGFHSCGDWSGWIDSVLNIKGIRIADGAFSSETDPNAISNLEAYHRFSGTGVVLNVRIVGDLKTIEQQVKRLWVPGMKLVVVTYCTTYDEQNRVYDLIHQICC